MHHYTNEKRYGLTVSHAFKTLSLCLPNNGHPVIVLNNNGAHTVSAHPVDRRQFSAFCALVEVADALLPVLDLVFSSSGKDVLESCGWQLVNQTVEPVELVHELVPKSNGAGQRLQKTADLSLVEAELAVAS
ncbi:MAG: hypothetical protein ICV77_04330 [Cyanobacteria bacterium Co-bin8]|nr:hypothetical protein [Cyanobacteria bacterium Co-bin8]